MFGQYKSGQNTLIQDLFFFTVSVIIAFWLIKSDSLASLLTDSSSQSAYLGAFIAGIFFTSVFTTTPAIVLLSKIAVYSGSPILVATFGAVGALMGDLIIFRFIHERLRSDVFSLVGKRWSDKLRHIFNKRIYHRYAPFVAAVIIASPLPDELGLAIIGMDERKFHSFELFTFVANFAGILIISLIAVSIT